MVTRDEVVAMLNNLSRPLIATLLTETEPVMVRKHRVTLEPNPYFGRVRKQSRVNGVIGAWNYENSVNARRAKEGLRPSFEALPRTWGVRLPGTGLVEYQGVHYVEVKVQRAIETVYTVDGTEATAAETAEIMEYLHRRVEGARQGVEKPVIVRDYALESVKALRVHGEQFDVG